MDFYHYLILCSEDILQLTFFHDDWPPPSMLRLNFFFNSADAARQTEQIYIDIKESNIAISL